jgi:DNA-binding Lrp family transcriptional regulator
VLPPIDPAGEQHQEELRRLDGSKHRRQYSGIQLIELAPSTETIVRIIGYYGLEEAGFITSYNARIDLAKLGETITVFTEVTLNDHHREDFVKFESSIRTVDEVIECHLISGGYDYLLKFLARGVAHYQSVIEDILERDIGVAKYFSYIVIKSPIEKLHYPLAKLVNVDP